METVYVLTGLFFSFILLAFIVDKIAEVKTEQIRNRMSTQSDYGLLALNVKYAVCLLVDNRFVKVLDSEHDSYEKAEIQLLRIAKIKENQSLSFSILPFYKAQEFEGINYNNRNN